jgi:hypothetical protein
MYPHFFFKGPMNDTAHLKTSSVDPDFGINSNASHWFVLIYADIDADVPVYEMWHVFLWKNVHDVLQSIHYRPIRFLSMKTV